MRYEVLIILGRHGIRGRQRHSPRIAVHAVEPVLVVQVRAGGEPRLSNIADHVALTDAAALSVLAES